MTETRHDFRLNFTSNMGSVITLNIPRADDTATPAEVAAAMQGIIDSDVVESARGTPVSAYSADLVVTQRRDIDIAE